MKASETGDVLFIMAFLGEAPTNAEEPHQHVTFLARTETHTNSREALTSFLSDLETMVSSWEAFELEVSGMHFFGLNQDIPVLSCADMTGEAQATHLNLLSLAQTHGYTQEQPQYTGDGFKPHITVTPSGVVYQPGTHVLIDNLVVSRHIGGFGGPTETVATFTL